MDGSSLFLAPVLVVTKVQSPLRRSARWYGPGKPKMGEAHPETILQNVSYVNRYNLVYILASTNRYNVVYILVFELIF